VTAKELCEICGAKQGVKGEPDDPCVNTLHPGEPLPGREYHYARTTKATATEKEPLNDACY
jgi:hypothetical protein